MNKEYPSLSQLDFHIINAIVNKNETISQIRSFVRNFLGEMGLNSQWTNISFTKEMKKLSDSGYIKRVCLGPISIQRGFIYSLNEEFSTELKQLVESYYKLNKIK